MDYYKMHKLLRLSQVKEMTGLSRSTIYLWISNGYFPKQIPMGPKTRCVGWLESEIIEWIEQQIKDRDVESE